MKKNATPDISVIVLTQNTPLMIVKRCLQSIRNQSLKNIEIVLLDSNTKESSYKKALQSEPALLENIVYLEIPEKSEYIRGKNAALKKCTGQFVTFLSSQDTMPSKRLEKVLAAFHSEDGEEYDAVYTNMTIQEKDILEVSDYPIISENYQFLPQLILRRKSFHSIGEFDADLVAHCDDEMWFRINSLLKISHLDSEDATVCVNPDFYTDNAPLQAAIGYRQIAVKYSRYFKENKKEKKALYYKIAQQYKAADIFFRYLQFQIKSFFIGNLHADKETNSLASLQPELTATAEEIVETDKSDKSLTVLSFADFLRETKNGEMGCHLILATKSIEQAVEATRKIIGQLRRSQLLSLGKIAVITAEALNELPFEKLKEQLANNCILIEHSANLQPDTVRQICSRIEKSKTAGVILSFQKQEIMSFLEQFPHVNQNFDCIINLTGTVLEPQGKELP